MELQQYQIMYNIEAKNWFYRGMRKILFDLINKYVRKTDRILDAGCGTGINLMYLGKYGKSVGIDFSKEAVKFCKKRGLKIKKGNVEKIPFKDNTFDLVTSIDVIYHKGVKDDLKALKEFYRVCEKNGYLVLRVPAFQFLYGNHDRAVHTKRRYTKNQIKLKLENAGFNVKKITYANMFLFPLALAHRFLGTREDNKSDLKSGKNILNGVLLKILYFEAFLIKYFNLPFGISIFCVAKK